MPLDRPRNNGQKMTRNEPLIANTAAQLSLLAQLSLFLCVALAYPRLLYTSNHAVEYVSVSNSGNVGRIGGFPFAASRM
jgi:hypothetical protein